MALHDSFSCGNGVFTIDECIKGQTPLQFYDALQQVALQKDLREGTVLCYWDTGIEGLFQQLAALLGADKRVVKSSPFYWTEICSDFVITTKVKKSAAAVPGAGVPVQVDIAATSHSANGKHSMVKAGHRAYIKELNGQGVNIIAADKSVTGLHTVTLKPLNNMVLDLTKFSTYTLLVDPLRMYVKGDNNCISTEGFLQNPPTLRKGYIQKFEKGYCVHEDELDGYAYDVNFRIFKGIDPKTGKKVDFWGVPELTNKLLVDRTDSRNIETLFGVRDDVSQQGFNGVITTAESEGMFNSHYTPGDGVSLKTHLMNMIKSIRKMQGCNDLMLLHDFNYGVHWSESLAQLVKDSSASQTYALFGTGGEGVRNFSWYNFKDFTAYGYNFRRYQIDMFDHMRYGNFLSDFALLMPACKFKDTNGKTVPPVTYVNIEGQHEAYQGKTWVDNTMDRGCRTLNAYIKDSFGLENHCASKLGVMRKIEC